MKRFFTNLKSLASKAMVVALAGVTVLSVSCNKDELDAINKNIDEIEASLEDLTARVDALEIRMSNEVKALEAMIAGVEEQIVIVDVTAGEDGTQVLTLKDGSKVTVYPKYEHKENGLTVVEENGQYYLAQVVDGVVSPLVDANGNKYYIHHRWTEDECPEVELPETHAAPIVQANAETGAMEVSFDGGATWYPLGGGDAGFFQSVIVKDGVLTFVLADGQEFSVALPEEVNFNIQGGRTFIAYEAETVLSLTAKGVNDIVLLEAPKGWNVALNGTKLNVVAPAEAAVVAGEAVAEGLVKALAISGENKAFLAKAKLTASAQSLEVEIVDGEAFVSSTMTYMYDMDWDGAEDLCSQYISFGVYEKAKYPTLDEVAAKIRSYDLLTNDTYPALVEEGQVVELTFDLAAVYADLNSTYDYDTYEWIEAVATPGETYWVIAFPFTNWDEQAAIKAEDMIAYEWTYSIVDFIVNEATFNSIDITANIAGYETYRAALYMGMDDATAQYEFQSWITGDYYWEEPFGTTRTDGHNFTGSLFEFGDWWGEIGWNTEYRLYILPLDGRALTDYTWDDVEIFVFQTADIVSGGTAVPTVAAREDKPHTYTTVYASLTNPGGTIVYTWFTQEQSENYTTDAMIYEYLWDSGYRTAEASENIQKSSLSPGQTITFVGCLIDEDGKYGPITKVEFATPSITYNDNVSVKIVDLKSSNDGKNALFKLEATGTEAAAKYLVRAVGNFTWTSTYKEDSKVREWFATNTNLSYYTTAIIPGETATDADGYYSVKRDSNATGLGDEQRLLVAPIDANGTVGVVAIDYFIPDVTYTLISSDDPRWAASKPEVYVEYTWNADWQEADTHVYVTLGEGAVNGYYKKYYEPLNWEEETTDSLVKMLIATSAFTTTPDKPKKMTEYLNSGSSYDYTITWTDAEGNYYEPVIVEVRGSLWASITADSGAVRVDSITIAESQANAAE